MSAIRWAYGVTTVPERQGSLLNNTLRSLENGGFPDPHLFIDGERDTGRADYQVTYRWPRMRTFGNWSLGLWELLIRHPEADRYAMFQDDFVTYKNLRQYLERVPYPEKGYQNLYTFPSNQEIAPKDRTGWYESRELTTCSPYEDGRRSQTHRGAVALVFSKEAVVTLFTSRHFVMKPLDVANPWKKIDGCIGTALNREGWREFVHNPSLVQHIGKESTMGNAPHLQATSFKGEDFDALELLRC